MGRPYKAICVVGLSVYGYIDFIHQYKPYLQSYSILQKTNMTVYILIDPRDHIIRYVGITSKTAEHRLRMHIKDAKTRRKQNVYLSNKDKWLLELFSLEMRPIIKIAAEGLNKPDAELRERQLIAEYKRLYEGGTLYNVQEGGDYYSLQATPWNRGQHNCYTEDFILNNRIAQPNCKTVYRFDKKGNLIDVWPSVRRLCDELNFDRRAVMRCLKGEKYFMSHKGFMFSFTPEPPVYVNRSTLLKASKSHHAKRVTAIDGDNHITFNSIIDAARALNIPNGSISCVLIGRQKTAHGYKFEYA